eukprot:TRINITY_DN1920_c0_g1_i1.p1 TRINITY_DN1920_c0_g1~~TRINITY_DN1920_c0_g1_i1.p1  ORF type:complete len:305 (-),score=14.08 TRINITY_DN1920_c0_g1_i1:192-1106(-)
MGLPSDFMTALTLPSVTNARASEDNFPGSGHWFIGHTSMLISALGLNPFKDNFWTNSTQPDSTYGSSIEWNPALQAVVSVFSAGPVGISDSIGATDATLIMRTCMADGTLLKPSKAATSFDPYFLTQTWSDSQSHIWNTHSWIPSQSGSLLFFELLCINMYTVFNVLPHHVWPVAPTGMKYAYFTWGDPQCTNGASATPCLQPFSETTPIGVQTDRSNATIVPFKIIVIAPVLSSGWTVLGEVDKFVTTSPKRFAQILPTATGVSVDVVGSPSEVVSVLFASPQQKLVQASVTISGDGTGSITV